MKSLFASFIILLLLSSCSTFGICSYSGSAWNSAIKKASLRAHRDKLTYCDGFVRYVFDEYHLDDFNNRNIIQLKKYAEENWEKVSCQKAAYNAQHGIPTIALTTNYDPPRNHIVVLTGGLDEEGNPRVMGSGAFSGPEGARHRRRRRQWYQGYVYRDFEYHWEKKDRKYITFFSKL